MHKNWKELKNKELVRGKLSLKLMLLGMAYESFARFAKMLTNAYKNKIAILFCLYINLLA